MKQFKIVFALFGILCIFVLNGCVGGSGSSGSTPSNTVSTASSKNDLAAIHSPDDTESPVITSFTLWGTDGDVNTAIAGEITTNDNGNQITIQVPAETTFPAKFYVTYTGADSIINSANNSEVTNHSLQSLDSTPVSYTVTKNNAVQNYTLSVITREPYFTSYYNDQGVSKCVVDLDGNVWLSDPTKFGTFNQVEAFANMPFFKACQPISGWHLPNKQQAKSLLDKIPSDYRMGTSGKTAIDWFNMQKDSKGVKLFALDSFETNYWLSEPGSVMGVNTNSIYSVQPSLSTKFPGWPVASDGNANANFRTITDFYTDPQHANDTSIAGNQIFIPIDAWHPEGNVPTPIKLNFAATGGTITINGNKYQNGDIFTIPAANMTAPIIPVTVTSKTGK
ncbi:MAG TPA: hypothetical protein VKR58_00910, partial [Aquella sp.]|nr:hypothetical protein [Aquella sp.]